VRAIVNEECPGTRPNKFQLFIQEVFLICIKYMVAASVIYLFDFRFFDIKN
jgi:hypothetical protein